MNELSKSSGEERIGAEDLFRAHASYVAAFLRRLGAGASEVDDLVQEVFLVAHQKGGYTPGPARPSTWLCSIAVNLTKNRRRSLARRREDDQELAIEQAESTDKSPLEKMELVESLRRVQAALETLDVDHRAAFILYELENEPCDVIAGLLQVPVGTIYSRLHQARRRFQEAYAQSAQDSSPKAVVWGGAT